MGWNARIVKKKGHWGKVGNKKFWFPAYYGVHEVFYNSKGKPYACTENAMNITGESVKETKNLFDMYARAFDKPVLNYEDFGPKKKRKS